MMKITIIALATLKEKYLREAAAEYEKRLKSFCKLNIIELVPERLPEKPSASEISAALSKEAERIIKRIPSGSLTVALCIEGENFSSENLATFIGDTENAGEELTFIIGSSYGLSEELKRCSDKQISFSNMTFPHQLFRIMLLEQVYRGFKINSGSAYHK